MSSSASSPRAFVSCQQNDAVEKVLDTLPTNTEFVVSNNNFNERGDAKAQSIYFGSDDKKARSTLLRIPAFGEKMNATAFPDTAIGKSEFHYGQLMRAEGNPFDACADACSSRGYNYAAEALRTLKAQMTEIATHSDLENMSVEDYATLAREKTGLDIYLPAKHLMAQIATKAEGSEGLDLSFFETDRDLGQKLNRAMNVLSGLISCKGAAADVLNVLAAIFGKDADLLEGLRTILGSNPLTYEQLLRSFFDDLFMDFEHDDLAALVILLLVWDAADVERTLNVHAFAPPSVSERIKGELQGLVEAFPLCCSEQDGVTTIVSCKTTVHFRLREDPQLDNGKKIEQALNIAPLKEVFF
jgi:hypothetical protein